MQFSNFSTTHFKSNRKLKTRAMKLNFHNCSDDQKTENKDKWGIQPSSSLFYNFFLSQHSPPPTTHTCCTAPHMHQGHTHKTIDNFQTVLHLFAYCLHFCKSAIDSKGDHVILSSPSERHIYIAVKKMPGFQVISRTNQSSVL